MPRSSPRPFANLRAWAEWLADYGRGSACCQKATLDDIKARPEKFDCASCMRQRLWSNLWPENRTAWDCFQALTHRTVRDIQAGAWVIENFTAGWSWQRINDLLQRLDVILDILVPQQGRTEQTNGRRTET